MTTLQELREHRTAPELFRQHLLRPVLAPVPWSYQRMVPYSSELAADAAIDLRAWWPEVLVDSVARWGWVYQLRATMRMPWRLRRRLR